MICVPDVVAAIVGTAALVAIAWLGYLRGWWV